ncbi:type II toxin-antitoxin system Phd/YefM family antitoxin [Pinibacter aurantiacus]|uniref:Antitoxin n=1 Tax=Pinibacter aurantiacus TaxID=2851599 RepID=A0A9E2SDL3_9BACT|nr:type II toxin-antitoxin system Phd/YefM family antitoxin [Pinibacter aurantiacus]MBV4358625.1 type II toxin-antitoxin system Phd/YefM family antitoxin [Pinibacter aurantiacus]MDH7461632.1 type II toxin-antitoxin system Phd/YefM family antitoxin [Chitinophagaceae bacterium 26-R-25]
MLLATISDFRKDMARFISDVIDNHETLIIHKEKGTGVVVMSLEEYNSLEATLHEMNNPVNRKRLNDSIESLKKGKLVKKELL